MALFPSSGSHSVQNAAFAIEWQPELNATELGAVMGAHATLIKSLPIVTTAPMLTVQMTPNGVSQMVPGGVGGVTFSRNGSAGAVSRSLEVDRMRCVAQINDYTRWASVWPEVRRWFEAVIPIVGKRQFTSIGIQYNDVFHWRDKPENLKLDEVFSSTSKLLPASIFSNSGLWHSHNGYFVQINKPIESQLLENLNVNLVDNLGQRSIIITTVHKASVSFWSWDEVAKIIDPLMEVLHQRNKDALSGILSESAIQMIALNKGK